MSHGQLGFILYNLSYSFYTSSQMEAIMHKVSILKIPESGFHSTSNDIPNLNRNRNLCVFERYSVGHKFWQPMVSTLHD